LRSPRALRRGGRFQAIAHRGDPVDHAENTLPGINSAVRAGADLVEIDIKTTADGNVVVLHDDTLERIWGDPRLITEVRTEELSAIGTGDHRVPLLSEVLALIGGSSAGLLIDMDHPRWAGPGLSIVSDAIDAGVVTADQIVWCGRPDSLRIVRDADPGARIVFSWDQQDGDGALPPESMIMGLSPEAFNPHWPMIDDHVFDWAAGLGLAVCCWTVDDDEPMRQLLGRGIDAMITNRIHRLQELRFLHARSDARSDARSPAADQ
jgi:glycerophosphoryl diester phosphodiesterase